MAEEIEKEKSLNEITIGDFQIKSSTESLDKLKEIINELIEKHKDFAIDRRKLDSLKSIGIG